MSVPSAPKRVLLVGDFRHREFREAVDWLGEHAQLETAATVPEALSQLRDGAVPDVILFAQSRPGQLARGDVERLHAASPISRLVTLVGSWCEGELRSGRPWPGVVRIYWHQWQARIIPELTTAGWPADSLWRLPRTSTASEQYERAARVRWPRRSGLIAVVARTFRSYAGLRDACRFGGYATVWSPPSRPAVSDGIVAAIWDGDDWHALDPERLKQRLEQVIRQYRAVPVIALLDIVRRQDYDAARATGAAAVLAKPFLVRDLLWHVDVALRQTGPSPPVSSAA